LRENPEALIEQTGSEALGLQQMMKNCQCQTNVLTGIRGKRVVRKTNIMTRWSCDLAAQLSSRSLL